MTEDTTNCLLVCSTILLLILGVVLGGEFFYGRRVPYVARAYHACLQKAHSPLECGAITP